MTKDGTLYAAMASDVGRGREDFAKLEARYGAVEYPRLTREYWIEGNHSEITVLVGVDAYPVVPMGRAWQFGNDIVFQLHGQHVEGEAIEDWIRMVIEDVVEQISVDYGYATTREDYWQKNMSTEAGGLRAVGRDISRYLPGLYWLNYFGHLYVDLIGRERFRTAPASDVREIGGGFLVSLAQRPSEWESGEFRTRSERVLDHIGREYFFSRAEPERATRAPRLPIPIVRVPSHSD
jgi:hypothetical protein